MGSNLDSFLCHCDFWFCDTCQSCHCPHFYTESGCNLFFDIFRTILGYSQKNTFHLHLKQEVEFWQSNFLVLEKSDINPNNYMKNIKK